MSKIEELINNLLNADIHSNEERAAAAAIMAEFARIENRIAELERLHNIDTSTRLVSSGGSQQQTISLVTKQVV